MVFVAIWLAWMNFTWFASAHDTDDVVYRLSALAIMTGALIMAAGVLAIGVVLGGVVAAKMRLHLRDAARVDPHPPVEPIRV